MNRGTHTVWYMWKNECMNFVNCSIGTRRRTIVSLHLSSKNEFCPVSMAHHFFTALGLRHLIVYGNETGGEVVGVLTRVMNLLKGLLH